MEARYRPIWSRRRLQLPHRTEARRIPRATGAHVVLRSPLQPRSVTALRHEFGHRRKPPAAVPGRRKAVSGCAMLPHAGSRKPSRSGALSRASQRTGCDSAHRISNTCGNDTVTPQARSQAHRRSRHRGLPASGLHQPTTKQLRRRSTEPPSWSPPSRSVPGALP